MNPTGRTEEEQIIATSPRLGTPVPMDLDDGSNNSKDHRIPRKRKISLLVNMKNKAKRVIAPRVKSTTQEVDVPQDLGITGTQQAISSHASLPYTVEEQRLPPPSITNASGSMNRNERLQNIIGRVDEVSRVPGEWELDQKFLMGLLTWDREHPQSTLSNVLRKINDAIEKAKPFLDIIPNAPFPAQSLVKGLAQILQLSVALSDADRKLNDFVFGVVAWISDLKHQVASFGNEDFTKATWDNLTKIREIVDRICGWAKSRLDDKRWTKLDMDKEISEFETLVQKARQTFADLSLITISGSISALKNMLEEIQKVHKAHEEGIVADNARRGALHRELDPHTASRPAYNMQGRLPCEPESRIKVLEEILDWIYDHSASSQNFLWLTGDPGCGKSAITASISRVAKGRRFLWAQFFINRNLEQTTNPNMYFPTIARQLSDNSILVERHVYDTVMETHSLLDEVSANQAAQLFISAVSKASMATPNAPVLVVIDGLDETDHARLYDTATIFSNLFDQLSAYPNAKILISSRTEHEIFKPFTSTLTNNHVKRLHLDTQDPSCLADVGNYMRNQLDKIARKHDLDRTSWPGREREERLVDQAAGLYIWATTVTKFLDARIRKQGREDLDGIIDKLKLPYKADINVFYLRILQVTYDNDEDETTDWDLEKFRRIMGAIVVAREPLSVSQLDALIDLRCAPGSPHSVDIRNFVQLLRTVLVSGMDSVTGDTMIRLHKSFFEFITTCNEDRFRVNLEAANAEMTLCCLQHLANSHTVVTSTQFAVRESDIMTLPWSTRYALRFCFSHVPRQSGQMLRVVLANSTIKFFPQLNALVPPSTQSLPLSISLQQNHPPVIWTSLHTHSLIWNVDDGSPTTPIAFKLHMEVDQFFPFNDGRFFGSGDTLIDAQTFRLVRKLHRHELVASVSLSPDETKCVVVGYIEGDSGSGRPIAVISIWNISTGERIGEFDPGKFGYRHSSAVFAHDNIHIISASPTGIEIWNIETKRLVRNIVADLTQESQVTLSPDGAQILHSKDNIYTLLVWDYTTCQLIGEPFRGHTDSVTSTAFSPNSKYILSSSKDGTVRLWDIETHRQLGGPWVHAGKVDDAFFSPDGSYVLSFGHDGFRLFKVPNGQCTVVVPSAFELPTSGFGFKPRVRRGMFFRDGQQAVYPRPRELDVFCHGFCVSNISPYTFHIKNSFIIKWSALSTPHGNLLIYSDSENTLYLSRLDSMRFGGLPLLRDNHRVPISSVAFSPDERSVAAACEDGMVVLWSTEDNKLITTYQHDLARGLPTLSFVRDGSAIVVKATTGKYLLIPIDDQLIPSHHITSIQEASSINQDSTSSIPHVYSDPLAPNRRLETVRWFPSADTSGGVLWAYIGNYIIRAGKDGRFVIIPVTETH